MKLEKQVPALKYSKKLQELGVKQESHFRWGKNEKGVWEVRFFRNTKDIYGLLSAFTVAELGEKLAKAFNQLPGIMIMNPKGKFKKLWTAITGFDNEAENRAKMLIYLIENKLIKKEK